MHFHREKPRSLTAQTSPKPTLPMTQLPIFRVHYQDLEDYLCRVFHWDSFDFLMAAGTAAGMSSEYNVSPTVPGSHDAPRRADAIRGGRRTREVPLILTVLCADGYIPAGRYIVDTRAKTAPIEQYKQILRATGNPESEECRAFRAAHKHDRQFVQLAAAIDAQVLQVLREMRV